MGFLEDLQFSPRGVDEYWLLVSVSLVCECVRACDTLLHPGVSSMMYSSLMAGVPGLGFWIRGRPDHDAELVEMNERVAACVISGDVQSHVPAGHDSPFPGVSSRRRSRSGNLFKRTFSVDAKNPTDEHVQPAIMLQSS